MTGYIRDNESSWKRQIQDDGPRTLNHDCRSCLRFGPASFSENNLHVGDTGRIYTQHPNAGSTLLTAAKSLQLAGSVRLVMSVTQRRGRERWFNAFLPRENTAVFYHNILRTGTTLQE